MKLYIGNKNYSSWSLRPWLVLRHTGAAFEEALFPLYAPGSAEAIGAVSPSGLVPVLEDGPIRVWDSLAIAEYLAERFPEACLWPDDRGVRAVARAVSAEMHSGFAALRSHMTMNVRADRPGKGRGPGVDRDVERVLAIWSDCRARFGAGGDFLFGRFSVADAMYAPVVSRFRTYGVTLSGVARDYADAVWALPSMQAWANDARAEPWTIEEYER